MDFKETQNDDLKFTSDILKKILQKSTSYENFLKNLYDSNFDIDFEKSKMIFYDIESSRKYYFNDLSLETEFKALEKRIQRIAKLNELKNVFNKIRSMNFTEAEKSIKKLLNQPDHEQLKNLIADTKRKTGHTLSSLSSLEAIERQTKWKTKVQLLKENLEYKKDLDKNRKWERER